MIDIHQHVAFGVDDGANTPAEAKKMLTAAADRGIDTVFATSHAGLRTEGFPVEAYRSAIGTLRAWIQQKGLHIRLMSGSEILFSGDTVRKLDAHIYPTLGGTEWVLVEFMPDCEYLSLFQGVKNLANAGYRPILAHVERYECLRRSTKRQVEDLKATGVRLQMNSNTVIKNDRFFRNRFVHLLLKGGYIDYVATDAHNATTRPVQLDEAYKVLVKQYGKKTADELCGLNQTRDIIV